MSEGSREIESMKQRLAAAKAQASSAQAQVVSTSQMMNAAHHMLETAKKNHHNATKNYATAQKNMEDSQKEVKVVEALLKEAEKRWEVIDVDAIDSPNKASRKKKRKVSSDGNDAVANGAATAPRRSTRSSSITSAYGSGALSVVSTATATPSSNAGSNSAPIVSNANVANNDATIQQAAVIREVKVEGCGISEANGTYKRVEGRERNDAPIFRQRGEWEGVLVDFVLLKSLNESSVWYLSVWKNDFYDTSIPYKYLYNARGSESCQMPPGNGWGVSSAGKDPAPKCQAIEEL